MSRESKEFRAKYGSSMFQISGLLEEVPTLEEKGKFKWCKFVIIVTTRTQARDGKDAEDVTQYIQCTAQMFDAERLCKYGKKDGYYTIIGTVRAKEWDDKDGNTQLGRPELVATKILGGN